MNKNSILFKEMVNWGAYSTLPSFSPVVHTTSGWSDMSTPFSDVFLDVPGVDPDQLAAGIRAEWKTCGADPGLSRKVALKNIEKNPHYYSSLEKYDIYGMNEDELPKNVEDYIEDPDHDIERDPQPTFEDHVLNRGNINLFDLFAGMGDEKNKGLCTRKAGLQALGNITAIPGYYNNHPSYYAEPQTPIIYGDYQPIENVKGNTLSQEPTKPFGDSQTTIAVASMDNPEEDAALKVVYTNPSPNPFELDVDHSRLSESEQIKKQYPIGMRETAKFFQMADDSQIQTFDGYLKKGQFKKAWQQIKDTISPRSVNIDGDHQNLKNDPDKFVKVAENKIHGDAKHALAGSKINPKELAMGITIEMEHTDNEHVAAELASDHLKKDPKYYTKLSKIGLADECAPSLSSGLGDDSHPINKNFRIGKNNTAEAGNNISGNMGKTPSVNTKMGNKHDYSDHDINEIGDEPADWSLKGALHKKFPKNKTNINVKENKNGHADMVGKWRIDAYPVTGSEKETPSMKKNENKDVEEAHDPELAEYPNQIKLKELMSIEMGCNSMPNQELTQGMEPNVNGSMPLNKMIGNSIPNMNIAEINKNYNKATSMIKEIMSNIGSTFDIDEKQIDEHGAADDLGKDGCGYSWHAEPGSSKAPYFAKVKENLTKRLSEMEKYYGTGDYVELSKRTNNGQLSMLERIRNVVSKKKSSKKEKPDEKLNEKKKSDYRKHIGF